MNTEALLIFEIIGTIAFSVSGALIAISKKMDILGVAILGIVTAVGGGITRDIILGVTPPNMFKNPIYVIVALLAALVCFISSVRKFFEVRQKLYEYLMLVMDSVGLGVFTVVGIQTAEKLGFGNNIMLLLFVGTVTGVGGGVMRDLFARQTPYIFVKHFYATASILGSALCIALWKPIGEMWAMIISALLIVALRILAAHYKWNLPKA